MDWSRVPRKFLASWVDGLTHLTAEDGPTADGNSYGHDLTHEQMSYS
jgi:hypothetical protein